MDSATLTYLVNPRIKQTKEPTIYDPLYKQRILDLTASLFENKIDDTLQDSFNHYISDCMDHFKKEEPSPKIDVVPMKWDELMFVPKKVNMIAPKKNKNIFLKHDRT